MQVPRSDDFGLPGPGSKYFSPERSGQVTAKEHRNMMQVLPFILQDLAAEVAADSTRAGVHNAATEGGLRQLNADLVDVASRCERRALVAASAAPLYSVHACSWHPCIHQAASLLSHPPLPHARRWCTMHAALLRKNSPGQLHTSETLAVAAVKVQEFLSAFKRVLVPHMKSEGATVKLHKLAHHAIGVIEQLGALVHQSANEFEADFKATKRTWRCAFRGATFGSGGGVSFG